MMMAAIKCPICKNRKSCEIMGMGDSAIQSCGIYCTDDPPMRSNADRFRSMTDEELARLFADGNCGYCRIHDFCFAKGCQIDCEDMWLDWLREEAKL